MVNEAKNLDTASNDTLETSASTAEPTTHKVVMWMCELCIDGAGGECHVGGCAFFLNRAPDISIRHSCLVESIDGAKLDYDTLKRAPSWVGVRKGLRALFNALPEVGAVTADDLAAKLDRESANLSTALKKLWKRGLVKREGLGSAHHPYRWSRA